MRSQPSLRPRHSTPMYSKDHRFRTIFPTFEFLFVTAQLFNPSFTYSPTPSSRIVLGCPPGMPPATSSPQPPSFLTIPSAIPSSYWARNPAFQLPTTSLKCKILFLLGLLYLSIPSFPSIPSGRSLKWVLPSGVLVLLLRTFLCSSFYLYL